MRLETKEDCCSNNDPLWSNGTGSSSKEKAISLDAVVLVATFSSSERDKEE